MHALPLQQESVFLVYNMRWRFYKINEFELYSAVAEHFIGSAVVREIN